MRTVGFPWLRAVAVKGKLATGTVQLDRVVGRMCFGPQRSAFLVKKHLMTGADSLQGNLDVSSLNGQWLSWPEVARHHRQQVNAHDPVTLPQKFQNQRCPHAPHMRESPSLQTHVGALVSSSEERRIGFVPLPLFVYSPAFSRDSSLLIFRNFSVLKRMFVLLNVGSTTR